MIRVSPQSKKGAKEPLGSFAPFLDCGEPTKIEYDWGRGPIEYEIFVGEIVGVASATEQFRKRIIPCGATHVAWKSFMKHQTDKKKASDLTADQQLEQTLFQSLIPVSSDGFLSKLLLMGRI